MKKCYKVSYESWICMDEFKRNLYKELRDIIDEDYDYHKSLMDIVDYDSYVAWWLYDFLHPKELKTYYEFIEEREYV